jgi:hypothetical protein
LRTLLPGAIVAPVFPYLYIDWGTMIGVGLVLFIPYLLASWAIARYAARKGQSFAGFLLLGLLISPIISLIVALVIEDRTLAGGDRIEQLQKITDLRDAGTLSPQEFETEKARILAEEA